MNRNGRALPLTVHVGILFLCERANAVHALSRTIDRIAAATKWHHSFGC